MASIRLAVCSDLHNEFEYPTPPRRPTKAWEELKALRESTEGHPSVGPFWGGLRGAVDLIVMAGDIDVGRRGIDYADEVSTFLGVPVVIVAGNHEAYGQDIDRLIADMREAARGTSGRVLFLENETAAFAFGNRRLHVLGTCLWTDYTLGGDRPDDVVWAMMEAGRGLNDHVHIRSRGGKFTPSDARERHETARRWIEGEIARIRAAGDGDMIMVVTHHAPIPDAIPPRYSGGKLSPAFASDLRREIAAWRPEAWLWGHTHFSMVTEVGGTRLISSQRGYIGLEPGADEYAPLIMEI